LGRSSKPLPNSRTFMLPKRRFWKDEPKMRCLFSKHFFHGSWPKLSTHTLEKCSKIRISSFVHPLFLLPKSSFGRGNFRPRSNDARNSKLSVMLPFRPRTKIWEGRTNVSECVSPGSTFSRVCSVDLGYKQTQCQCVEPKSRTFSPRSKWV
jgi:hypothetical protein